MIGVGLTIYYLVSLFWDQVVTVVVVELLGPACGPGGVGAGVFCSVAGAILVL